MDITSLVPDPGAVVDWGPVINAAIEAADRKNLELIFPAIGDYPVTTEIDAHDTFDIVLKGPYGGGNSPINRYWEIPQWPARLLWKGAGSGVAVNANGGIGFTVAGLQIAYDNPGFTGVLLACTGNNWGCLISKAALTSSTKTLQSATLLSLDNTAYAVVEDSVIAGGRIGIDGAVLGTGYSNSNTIKTTTFIYCSDAFLVNPFQGWTVDECTFEMFGCARLLTMTGAGKVVQITFSNCWVGDEEGDNRPLFSNRPEDTWYARFFGNEIFTPGGPIWHLPGGGDISVVYNHLQPNDQGPVVDLGNADDGSTPKEGFTYEHNSGVCVVEAILNRPGHSELQISGGRGTGALPIQTLSGHVRLGHSDRIPGPLIFAEAALGDGAFVQIPGTDTGGYIRLTAGNNPLLPSTAGVVATVTFGSAMVPDPGGPGGVYAVSRPMLTPTGIPGGFDGDAGVECGASVWNPTLTGFQVRVKNAIPPGVTVLFAYDVKCM